MDIMKKCKFFALRKKLTIMEISEKKIWLNLPHARAQIWQNSLLFSGRNGVYLSCMPYLSDVIHLLRFENILETPIQKYSVIDSLSS